MSFRAAAGLDGEVEMDIVSRHEVRVARETCEGTKLRPYKEDPDAVGEEAYEDELAWKLSAPLYAVLQCDEYAHLLK